ncbi:unnamed protein product [Dicrocoelium dendriticum]|nr:unnamed protein product [Dicrocoelium dendriticum]
MYVFLMDKGQLVHLDSRLWSQNVSSLRNALAEEVGLPLEKQILLVSGGFQLEPGDKLSEYGAGMDQTNPIYIFTRAKENDDTVQKPDVLTVNDGGYPHLIETLLTESPSLSALNDRICALRALAPIAHETCEAIEQLVSEQRQMIQGWCVALANLAEVVTDTNKRLTTAVNRVTQFENCAPEWEQKLHSVSELKRELSDVSLLPQLVAPWIETCKQNPLFNIPVSMPNNLYDWICLQCILSFGPCRAQRNLVPASSRLQVASSRLLDRPDMLRNGRSRTTSAGTLDNVHNIPSPCQTRLTQSPDSGTPSSPCAHGSQHIFHNLSGLWDSSPALARPLPSGESHEREFLAIVHTALSDLNALRGTTETGLGDSAGETKTTMLYVRGLTSRLEQLLALVSSYSPNTVSLSTVQSQPPEPVALPSLDADTVRQTREALDWNYFSQLLSLLCPLSDEAHHMIDLIDMVKQNLVKVHQHACANKDISAVNDSFESHSSQLREVLSAFHQLCQMLNKTMQNKLYLAENLQQRQHWLQNFQSYIHRLDAGIHRCLSQMERITRTGTLIAQLQKAPEVYARCLVEVVRQHEFEIALVRLTRELRENRSDETNRRRGFVRHLRDNILHSLFAPWIGSSGHHCSHTKSTLLGSCRTLNNLDSDGQSSDARSGVSTAGRLEPKFFDSGPRRQSHMGSRSEPHLDRLVHSPASVRLASRTRPKETFIQTTQKLAEVHEDEGEMRVPELRTKHFSGTSGSPSDQRPLAYARADSPSMDALCHSFVPRGLDEVFRAPRWSLGDPAAVEDESPGTSTQPRTGCITRDDLDKLSAELPEHLARIIHEEKSKFLLHTQLSRSTISPLLSTVENPSVTRYTDPCSTEPTVDSSRPTCLSSVDEACQTEFAFSFQSPTKIWSSRSHSTSLLLPASGSPHRPLSGWEPLPSSLCSWELCPGPSGRTTLRRSLSTNPLINFTSTAAKQTQTDDLMESQHGNHLGTDPDPPDYSAPAHRSSPSPEPSISPQPAPPTDPPSPTQDTGDSPPSAGRRAALMSLKLDPAAADELFADLEYSTPTTMMSVSFHSTRTNLSNTDEPGVPTEEDDAWGASKGDAPTPSRPAHLVDRSSESRSADARRISVSSGHSSSLEAPSEEVGSLCTVNQLHRACVQLAARFHAGSDGNKITSTGCPVNADQTAMLNPILARLAAYVQRYPHPPCFLHLSSVPSPSPDSSAGPSCSQSAQNSPSGCPSPTPAEPDQNSASAFTLEKIDPIQPTYVDNQTSNSSTLTSRDTSTMRPQLGGNSVDSQTTDLEQQTELLPSRTTPPAVHHRNPSPSSTVLHPPLLDSLAISSTCEPKRIINFVHANFTPNDTVIFVPVHGSAPHHSHIKQRAIEEAEKEAVSMSSNRIDSLLPASSILSSTIIQSMDTSFTATALRSGSRRDLMFSSVHPGGSVCNSRSTLVKELLGTTMNELWDTPLGRSSCGPSTHQDRLSSEPPSEQKTSESAVTQWRMLSSDGHVYFLHQDDFASLGLDPNTDYCKPVVGSPPHAMGRWKQSWSGSKAAKPPQSSDDHKLSIGRCSYFVVASYQRKERCLSKKTENRFNLPKDFAFYRVRVKPLQPLSDLEPTSTTP